ncbi:hypothetical protein K6D78_002186 [Enterococcus faecalis]|nr:hypothetical protein [Enterococcus faecalis]
MKLLKWRWQWNKDHKKGEVSMKKVLPFIALVGLLLLSGCGTDMKKILTSDGGKWEGTGFGVSTQFTFYKDGEVSLLESGSSYSGTFSYNDKEEKLTIDISNIGKNIFSDVKEKNGKITAKYGKNKISLEKVKEK